MQRGPTAPIALALVLLAAAVAVRALPVSDAAPRPGADAAPSPIEEPMQLLWPGAGLRLAELDALVGDTRRGAWVQARRAIQREERCPETVAWLAWAAGQRGERLFHELVGGTPDEAFCALAWLFQVARRTAWSPGLFGGPEHAERLGGLYAAWLEAWGEAAVESALLREPALAAGIVYGHVMNVAAEGNLFSSSRPSDVRARRMLERLLGEPGRRLTAYGAALAARYPDAFSTARRGAGSLRGFADEAALWFPALDGDCDG